MIFSYLEPNIELVPQKSENIANVIKSIFSVRINEGLISNLTKAEHAVQSYAAGIGG